MFDPTNDLIPKKRVFSSVSQLTKEKTRSLFAKLEFYNNIFCHKNIVSIN